jgi:hypothetical protein
MDAPSRNTQLLVGAVVAAAVATVVALVLVTLLLVDTHAEPGETKSGTRPERTQPASDPIRTALESHPG